MREIDTQIYIYYIYIRFAEINIITKICVIFKYVLLYGMVCIYIYIYIERERDNYMFIIYIATCI